jgi:hypothetical protein
MCVVETTAATQSGMSSWRTEPYRVLLRLLTKPSVGAQRPSSADQLEPIPPARVCIHEAGHAVVAFTNRVEVHGARAAYRAKTIRPTRYESLKALVETAPIRSEDVERARFWTELKIILAGDVAERMEYGDCLADQGVELDDDHAKASLLVSGSLGHPESQFEEIAAKARKEVAEELRQGRAAVTALSRLLLERGQLTGEEIRKVIVPFLPEQ